MLQANGSIVIKKWLVLVDKEIKSRGLDAVQVIYYHDECQWDCSEDCAEEVKQIAIDKIREAGEYYNLKIRLDGEAKIGNNWAETH